MNGYESEEEERSEEERLLYCARHGKVQRVAAIFDRVKKGQISINVNCRGTSKANFGWTPLHLAAYFGHTDVVQLLLENAADVNIQNDAGDSPLHRAAYTGRTESVLLLLRYDADVRLKNAEGKTAKETARQQDIIDLIAATEAFEGQRLEEKLLRLARNGSSDEIRTLLNGRHAPNLNCHDTYGNTPLHNAALSGNKQVVVILLQHGADTSLHNTRGQTAYDVAADVQTARLLDVRPIKELQRDVPRFEGQLVRKTRFMGWRTFWVVLDKGVLSLFKTRADATTGTLRKGCKYLDNSRVECRRDVGHIFTVFFADETSFTFAVEPNLTSTVNRQKWENMLRDHIAYATQFVMLGVQDASDEEEAEEALPLGCMDDTLREAEAQQVVLDKQIHKVTTAIHSLGGERTNTNQVNLLDIHQQLNCILNTSQDMCSSLRHCLTMFHREDQIRRVQLNAAQEKSRILQASLRVLAQTQHDLERSLGLPGHRSPPASTPLEPHHDSSSCGGMSDSEDDQFYECDGVSHRSHSEAEDARSKGESNGSATTMAKLSLTDTTTRNGQTSSQSGPKRSKWGGRCELPVHMLSRNNFSVWTFLKQCIGKELSKITMPVIFNEPLSFLQRMTEYMEYSQLLNKAATCTDPLRRFELVVAFAASSSASNWERIGKPFNPMLGETYELDRMSDLGFKCVCEQVSHHPPVSAFHVTAPKYSFHGTIHPKLKFWGKSVEVTPKGLVTLHLNEFDETYTWQNVNCCVHNIIVGKLWIEHYGPMEIVNHKTKEKCVLNFKPSGWFGKDLHKVEGFLYNANKKKTRAFFGKWVEALYAFDLDVWEQYVQENGGKSASGANMASVAQAAESDDDPLPASRNSSCNLMLKDQRVLWVADARPADSDKYYNFTHYAMMLNELKPGLAETLAPTDSRIRPDMRKLEEGDLDAAAAEKNRMEEKQRAARKDRKKSSDEWQPRWFKQEVNKWTEKEAWTFTGKYWDKNWSTCPDIF